MKRIITFILVFMMTLILSACAFGQKVPKGYINAEEHFDTEGFQDYTDYCKYYYQDIQKRILPPSAITLRIFGRRQLQM